MRTCHLHLLGLHRQNIFKWRHRLQCYNWNWLDLLQKSCTRRTSQTYTDRVGVLSCHFVFLLIWNFESLQGKNWRLSQSHKLDLLSLSSVLCHCWGGQACLHAVANELSNAPFQRPPLVCIADVVYLNLCWTVGLCNYVDFSL